MAFSDLVATMDAACLGTFGVAATFHPKFGGSFAITGIIKPPAMEEQFQPGGTDGVSVVRFFVRLADLSPLPAKGDGVTIAGVTYDVSIVEADSEGGATLKLRRN